MILETDDQLANTKQKLTLIQQQIVKAKVRPATPANLESLRSLSQIANQLQEEIVRYNARRKCTESSLA